MTDSKSSSDLKGFRPAAVMVIDLVKHSTRPKSEIRTVQRTVEEVFSKAVVALAIKESVSWTYTGDGYVCTFIGDGSTRVLNFVDSSIPQLIALLAPHNQQIRVGLDYGLIRLNHNLLTGSSEHFDLPGIQAARLEAAASPNQVLCTDLFYQLFSPHSPQSFSETPLNLPTKDRTINAYVIHTKDYSHVRRTISTLLRMGDSNSNFGTQNKFRLLVVDDEALILDVIQCHFSIALPMCEITLARDGETALSFLRSSKFDCLLTDYAMPGMSGEELSRMTKQLCPQISIIMMSGQLPFSDENMPRMIDAGVSFVLSKPFHPRELEALIQSTIGTTSGDINSALHSVTDDPAMLHALICKAGEVLQSIIYRMHNSDDLVHQMIRHKAKHIASEYLTLVQPGNDTFAITKVMLVRLMSLNRLCATVSSIKQESLVEHIRSTVKDAQTIHKRIQFSIDVDQDILQTTIPVSVVPAAILAITELIDNAIEAIVGKGSIDVVIRHLRSKTSLYVVVKDSGPGVTGDGKVKMFTEGHSTRGEGRGLGLYLIASLLKELRGDITYANEEGSTFCMLMPMLARQS